MNPVLVDTFLAARGAVQVRTASADAAVRVGDRLRSGMQVRTGCTGFALLTVGSVPIRVGPWTTLELTLRGHIKLECGRIYVDSGRPGVPPESLVVDTGLGRLTDLGAQYQVRLDPLALSVSVRDGTVLIDEGLARRQTLTRWGAVDVFSNGAVRRVAAAPYGARWAWTGMLPPELPIHGRPLSAFIAWYIRETGYTLVLRDPVTQADLDRTLLHGNIKGLSPEDAFAAVMHMTQLEFVAGASGELSIERPEMAETGT